MSGWLKPRIVNVALGLTVLLGLIGSGATLILNRKPTSLTVSKSSSSPSGPRPLTLITVKEFKDQQVPLDGMHYKDTKFTNVCLLYDGGNYLLENVTFTDHWKVCVRDMRLINYVELANSLKLFARYVSQSETTQIERLNIAIKP